MTHELDSSVMLNSNACIATGALICVTALLGCSRPSCDYSTAKCSTDEVCAFVEPGKARCVGVVEADLELEASFEIGTEFWCSQGGRSHEGRTHSFQGDLFALDLASNWPAKDLHVVSPVSGDVYVYDQCDERDSSREANNNTRCGLGYGNHVKIWDGTNIYLMGHLAHVVVKPGKVRRGQVLGTMGCSGAAGHRHVHLSVTRPGQGDDLVKVLTTPGWKGQTPVRFRFAARSFPSGAPVMAWPDTLGCADDRERAVALQR